MNLRRSSWRLLVMLAGIALSASAQDVEGQDTKNEVTGMIGRVFISDHQVISTPSALLTSGPGLSFEVNYSRKLFESPLASVAAEFPFVLDFDEDVHFEQNLVPGDYRAFFVTPSGKVNLFPQMRLSPWISLGGGFARFSEGHTLEFGGANPGRTGTTTGVLQIGAGLDVPLNHRFGARVQVRDFYAGIPQLNVDIGKSRQHNLFVGGGLSWKF